MSLRVLDPGLFTLPVDFGRPRSRSLGVPVGGAADRTALAVGNALVGNPPDAVALEISLAGPTLEAGCELACVLYGASFELSSSRQQLRPGKTFTLRAGERVSIGGARDGVRSYFCVTGGFSCRSTLGSGSGWQPLKGDEELSCSPGRIRNRFARINWSWEDTGPGPTDRTLLRILDGPQADWFPAGVLGSEAGLSQPFRVSPSSNRMGLRLEGVPLPHPGREMVSEPVCPGAVQVTRDGQCIILGIDGQTIGGYPKTAQVISADLDTLGQLRPGSPVVFCKVDLSEAERLGRARRDEVRRWCRRIRTALGGVC